MELSSGPQTEQGSLQKAVRDFQKTDTEEVRASEVRGGADRKHLQPLSMLGE